MPCLCELAEKQNKAYVQCYLGSSYPVHSTGLNHYEQMDYVCCKLPYGYTSLPLYLLYFLCFTPSYYEYEMAGDSSRGRRLSSFSSCFLLVVNDRAESRGCDCLILPGERRAKGRRLFFLHFLFFTVWRSHFSL